MNRKGTNENISVTNRNMAFFSPCTHNYVKIAVSKEIYTILTENVQNPSAAITAANQLLTSNKRSPRGLSERVV